jgi:tetratricopeptide (TPR) repeat protein
LASPSVLIFHRPEIACSHSRTAAESVKEKRNNLKKADAPATISPGRRWCFRFVALLIPLFVLALLEITLRFSGYGYPTHFLLADRLKGQKVLRDNQQFGWRFFPAAIARTTRPVVLLSVKPPQTCRIYVFGESAAFGDPSPAFGLPRVLEVLLRNRYPSVHFEVVNAAMTAINSNVILPIAQDCARADGDIWVLYMGNNEVVGPYGGGTVFGPQVPSLPSIRASIWFKATKISQLLVGLRESLGKKKSSQPSNVSLELFLDQKIRHDDPRMEKVYAHFARNLADILETGTHAGAKIVVSTVAVNLKDCAPFSSLHRTDLTDGQKTEWERLYQAGINAEQAGIVSEAMQAYSQASNIDNQWADLQFRQGRLLWHAGEFTNALQHFTLACDYDALRFRADTRLNEILRSCTNRLNEGVAFLDGGALLAQHSPHGVPGNELFYEHVHLNFAGNYWLARGIAEQITDILKPPALKGQTPTGSDWIPAEVCAAQLALTEWDRSQTLDIVRQRLDGPPFTFQLNHEEQRARVQKELAECRSNLSAQTISNCVHRSEQALALNPNDWALHQKLAQLLQAGADKALSPRAIEEWRRVIALVPHCADAHYGLGVVLGRANQTAEAEAELRRAVGLNNYYPNALNGLGKILAAQNRLPEAVENYEKAIQLKPHFPEALVNLGEALERLGKKSEAKARFEEASRLAPANTEATAHVGKMLDEKGELSAAVTRYTEILRATPENTVAHYNLGRCLVLLGRSGEAREQYAEALRLQPDFADAHCELGIELAKSGKEAEAMTHFREAVRLKPDSEVFHKSLGVALARQHQFEEATKEFETAVRLDPNDAAAQQLLQAARRSGTGAIH